MSFVAVATGVGALGSLASGIMSSNAAGDAADKQAAAADRATQLQRDIYNQNRADQEPWRQAGSQALSQMGDPSFQHDFSMSDFQADPGYAFRMQQGQQALERSAAARGGLQSGGFMKALDSYSQGLGSEEYQNAYNRFTNNQTNRFNRLSSIAGLGQTANGQNAASGANFANNAGQNMMGAANAQGAAGIAGANAWGNSLSSLGNLGMQGAWMNKWNQGQTAAPMSQAGQISGGSGSLATPTPAGWHAPMALD